MSLAARLRTRTTTKSLSTQTKPSMASVIKAAETVQDRGIITYKAADGVPRWIARSSTATRDKDDQIVSRIALIKATEKMRATGQYGPLRWWHMGTRGECTPVDIGDCDFSFVCGHTLYEGGTLRDPIYEKVIKADDEISIAFPPVDKDADNVYYDIDIILERSVCPRGMARNLFTGVSIV